MTAPTVEQRAREYADSKFTDYGIQTVTCPVSIAKERVVEDYLAGHTAATQDREAEIAALRKKVAELEKR